MTWDWTIKITDIIMVIAIFAGPIIAVRITEKLRLSKDSRDRKVHIFRNLMATRSAPLAAMHIEALNLVELEFQAAPHPSASVVAAARLYMDHLRDSQYPKDMWGSRKGELLVDLLYEMSKALDYNFDKVQIKAGSYYPSAYGETDEDNYKTRKLWLEILEAKRLLPIASILTPSLPTDKIEEQQIETQNKNIVNKEKV